MPRTIEFISPIRIEALTRVIRVRGADVYIHWSVFLVAGIWLLNSVEHLWITLIGLLCYLAMLFIHECGHLIAAQRMGCKVLDIKLYPIFGVTHFDMPWTRFDHCVIAWGGVVAQMVVALPLIIWVWVFGFTPFGAVNMVLAVLGLVSLGVAAFNLLPVAPLDGAIAWGLIPEAWKRLRNRGKPKRKAAGGWRSY
jgi:membrane-associated protease RseP (regulator of RpoE activity)